MQCCDSALKSNPAFSAALHHRGNLLSSLKRYAAALESYDQALAINPDNADILINRSTALSELKRYEAALASCDLALSIRPGDADALNNRGSALRNLGRHEEALVCHEQLLEQRPDSLEALVSRGLTLNALNRHQDALDAFDRALHVDPDRASAYFCRGIILASLARHEEALNSYERALDLQPDYIEAHHNRGTELLALRRHEAALHSFGKALALNPDFLPSLCTRGELLSYLKRAEDAIKDYTRLLALSPDYDFAQGRLLHAKTICCDWRDLDALSSAISENLLQGKKSAEPFSCIGTFSCALLMKRCAEIYAAEKFPRTPRDASAYKPRAENKIRVGYVAGEFRRHATSFLLAELFEKHDTSRFELFAFDNGWNDGSVVRKRLENAFTEIVDISRLGDWEAVAKIRDKGVDILVDLNGHVGRKRTGIFSHRPAPIQVNWLGYPGTMGVDFMDYIIADAHLIPDGHEVYYSEKIVRLPDTYQANDSKREIAGPAPSRAEAGLPPSGFVFCCFNNNFKITPEVFDVWMRLLRQVEHSVLWLFVDNAAACRNLRAEAAARGVTPDRLVFAAPAKLPDHLARYQLADLFLDTLPCNAHTTASDALWEGLPLLTCMGTTFAGRVAGSLLHAVGLPELVTNNLADYEALALRLATTPALLADLRQRLARNKSTHALFDSDRFRKNIESAYLTMMERWSRGEAPVSFSVNSANESIRL